MVNDWELPEQEIAKLPRPRAIAAVCQGVIEEFGNEEGPLRLCVHVCTQLVHHAGEPEYIEDCELWRKTVNAVCERRGIAFDADTACAQMLSEAMEGGKAHRKASKAQRRPRRAAVTPRDFEQRVSEGDELRARAWGIKLD